MVNEIQSKYSIYRAVPIGYQNYAFDINVLKRCKSVALT